jgi:SAM-dependent methyltransferase
VRGGLRLTYNYDVSLKDVQRSWNELAQKDAMWAVLTGPVGSERAWDPEAFFRTGVEEIAFILDRVRAAGVEPAPGRALDFGCGVGRLTQALCGHFAEADGVDIAEAMIERARTLNRIGDRCRYHLNERDDLGLFSTASFDFVYSSITLQHMPAEFSRRYIAEFFRVARPGGVVVFQVPAGLVAASRPRTRSTSALPGGAYRASIEAPVEVRCSAGEQIIVRVTVRNDGPLAWPALGNDDGTFSIRLGNHWRRRFGWMLQFNDVRAALPHDVAPGETVEIGFCVAAPAEPGRYVLEFDMVHENLHWFATLGSRTARVRVKVGPAVPRRGDAPLAPARMEMHGIARDEVEAIVAGSGGTLRAVEENDAAGAAWHSYRYIATR